MEERIVIKPSQEFTDSLKDEVAPSKYPEIEEKIHEIVKTRGEATLDGGVYGDVIGCGAYREYESVNQDGLFTKYLGCSYLYKGVISAETIDRLNLLKRNIVSTIRLLTNRPFIYFLPFLLPFYKKVIEEVIIWIGENYESILGRNKDSKGKEFQYKFDQYYCPAAREVIRVGMIFIEPDWNNVRNVRKRSFVYFCADVIQHDNAYKTIFQDAFGLVNCEEKEYNILSILEIIKERTAKGEWTKGGLKGLNEKWERVEKLVKISMFVPGIRKFWDKLFEKLDRNRIKPDEADNYFTLRRRGYLYGGISWEERLREAENIDKDKEHILLGV